MADSYNDCIKLIDPAARTSKMWLGGFSEPAGISCNDTHAYVADTNAHRIMIVDLETREMTELKLS